MKIFKSTYKATAAVACLIGLSVGSFYSCKESGWVDELAQEKILVHEVSIAEDSEIPLLLGRDTVLHASFSPDTVSNAQLVWSSSNEEVVTVDQQGKVKSVGLGDATVQVASADGSLRKAEVMFHIIDKIIYAEQINLSQQRLDTYPKVKTKITAVVVPNNVTYKKLVWKSSNENIAVVNELGEVTGVAPGTATITVQPADGSATRATLEVNVIKVVPIESIVIHNTFPDGLGMDERVALDFEVIPATASKQLVNWSSSDESVLKVDQNGVLTALAGGKVTITATSTDGGNVSSNFEVEVMEGKINDFFIDGVTSRWITPTAGASVAVNDNLLWVTMNVGAKRRGDIRRNNTTLHIGKYPILAVKFKRPLASAGNIFLDTNLGRWKQTTANGNNQMQIIKDADGVEVFYADLGAFNTFGTAGATLPTNAPFTFSQIGIGVADMPTEQNPVNPYPVYWAKTFKSVAELEAYLNQ